MIVKDAMVLIHLAKITLLRKSCEYFSEVIIPTLVYEEILKGEDKGYGEVILIKEAVNSKMIKIIKVTNNDLLERAKEFNIKEGEGEAVALYWQEKADFLATDDDNVRRKEGMLSISIIGTPAIIINLYKSQLITEEKYLACIEELKKIGWFSNQVIDRMKMEVKKWNNQ